MQTGAVWGLGHGLSAVILGMSAYFLKDRLLSDVKLMHLSKLSHLAESAVGISLLLIGLLGVKECLAEGAAKKKECTVNCTSPECHELATAKQLSSRALFVNGFLHGLSWDGAPGLAPAMAMSSWQGALCFLLAYGLGTIATMSITAGVVGEVSRRVSRVAHNEDLSRQLSLGSSVAAVAIGVYWTVKSFL